MGRRAARLGLGVVIATVVICIALIIGSRLYDGYRMRHGRPAGSSALDRRSADLSS